MNEAGGWRLEAEGRGARRRRVPLARPVLSQVPERTTALRAAAEDQFDSTDQRALLNSRRALAEPVAPGGFAAEKVEQERVEQENDIRSMHALPLLPLSPGGRGVRGEGEAAPLDYAVVSDRGPNNTLPKTNSAARPLTPDPSPARGEGRQKQPLSFLLSPALLSRGQRPRGITLVELLVVIFIVISITALAIPIVAPAMRGRQVREASRLVTAYLAGARAEAIRSGRPTGVVIERFSDGAGSYLPEFSIQLSRCQEPLAYSGDTMDARVAVGVDTTVTPNTNRIDHGGAWLAPTDPLARVQPGDLIKFNYQGHLYRLEFAGGQWIIGRQVAPNVWSMNSDSTNIPYVTTSASGVPYQVFRQPKRTSAPPLQLPAGVVIDLNFSGDDIGSFVSRNNLDAATNKPNDAYVGPMPVNPSGDPKLVASLSPVMLLFAPDGSVERVYRTIDADTSSAQNLVWSSFRPTGPIHLLIGRRERVPALLDIPALVEVKQNGASGAEAQRRIKEAFDRYNLFDLENLWITVHPQSGLATSTENATDPTIAIQDPANEARPLADRVNLARRNALEGQAMGGP